MSIPADIPNPDQENVYYSKPALKAELVSYFSMSKVEELLELFEDDRLITFVWDVSNAPNSFSLDVYPRNSSKYTIDLDSNGTFLIFGQNPELNTVEPKDFNSLKDGARTLILDPGYHSDSLLKQPGEDNFETVENKGLIDILCSTEFDIDMNQLRQKMEYYEVLKSIVRDSLKALPVKEREGYIEAYEGTRSTIDSVNSTIDLIASGQQSTYDQLIYENFINDLYPDTVGVALSDGSKGLEGTGALLVQAFSDFSRITIGPYIYKANLRVDAPSPNVFMNPIPTQVENLGAWSYFSSNFLDNLPEINMIKFWGSDNGGTTFPIENGSEAIFKDTDKILYDSANIPIWRTKDNASPKLNEWYYGNLDKKLRSEDSDFAGLDDYVDTIQSMTKDYKKHADLKHLAGGSLLVDQAVRKSILDLCLSNIDVSDFSPRHQDGTNFFSKIGRSSVLGPAGTTPYPTKYRTTPEGTFVPKPFSKNGFLCFQALLGFFNSFGSSSVSFLNQNLTDQNSDHDSVIGLWRDFHGSISDFVVVDMENSSKKTNLKQALHLYVQDEEITTPLEDIYLVPNGDDTVPANERTFFQFNVRGIKCAFQDDLVGYQSNYSLQSGNMVKKDDKLDLDNTNSVFKTMGFHNDGSNGKRTTAVDYGSSLSFWKPRNYNMPYFWACCVSLWKAMTIGVLRELLESVNSILFETEEEYLVRTDEELLSMVNIQDLWSEILAVTKSIEEDCGLGLGTRPSADGTITIYELVGSTGGDFINLHQNAIGSNLTAMAESFLDFVSTVSEHSKIERVASAQFRRINYNSILPIEMMQSPSNPNFANGHGSGYFSATAPGLQTYLDKLEISDLEVSEGRSIQKNRGPAGTSFQSISDKIDSFLNTTINHFRNLKFIDHVCVKISDLKFFIEGFETPENVSDVFLKGYLSVERDFKDPVSLRNQVESKKNLYAADTTGLGNRWNLELDENFENWLKNRKDSISFVHVLGLKKDLWNNTDEVDLALSFWNDGSEKIVRNISVSYDISSSSTESKRLQNYLHLYRGIHIDESTFSENTRIIWSEDVQKSESGIFPWNAKDFEDNEPLRILDNVFVMSPWIFPDNYFLDVTNINEYHKLVFVAVYKEDIGATDMVGTFEWSIANDS